VFVITNKSAASEFISHGITCHIVVDECWVNALRDARCFETGFPRLLISPRFFLENSWPGKSWKVTLIRQSHVLTIAYLNTVWKLDEFCHLQRSINAIFTLYLNILGLNRSWKIIHGVPGKSWKTPGFFVRKSVGTLFRAPSCFVFIILNKWAASAFISQYYLPRYSGRVFVK